MLKFLVILFIIKLYALLIFTNIQIRFNRFKYEAPPLFFLIKTMVYRKNSLQKILVFFCRLCKIIELHDVIYNLSRRNNEVMTLIKEFNKS